jgi:hypothetical protein
MSNNIFWTQDPTILYKNNNYLEFIPSEDMTRTQQLNAVTRFTIYYLILVLILKKEEQWIHLGIVVIFFVIILFYSFDADTKGKQDELIRQKGLSEDFNGDDRDSYSPNFESGYYDSNGELHMGKYYGTKNKSRTSSDKVKYSLTDFEKYQKSVCRKPTIDNPFMNPLQADFNVENPPTACNVDDDEISEKVSNAFNDNLFRDVSDVFGRENSQRQFYTVPQMNPPDTHAFAMWLYGNQNICKNDQTKCMKYTDLRYNGGSLGGY